MTEPTAAELASDVAARRANFKPDTRQHHRSAYGKPTLPDRAPIRVIGYDGQGRKVYSRQIPYECSVRPRITYDKNGSIINVSTRLNGVRPRRRRR